MLVRPTVDLAEILRWNARRPISTGAPVDSGGAGRRGGLVIREFGIDNGTFLGESGWKLSGIQMHGSLNGRQDPWLLDVDKLVMRIRHGLIDESLSGTGKLAFARGALVVNEINLQSRAGGLHLSGVVTPPEAEGSSIAIEGSSVAIDQVAAWFGANHPLLRGQADLHLLARGRPDSLSLEGRLVRNRTGAPPQEIHIKAQREDNVIAFESLHFVSNGSTADLHGQIVLGELPAFNAFADFNHFDPRTLWETQIPAKPWSLSGTVRLEGRGLTRQAFIGEGNAHWGQSSFLGVPFDSAELSFTGNQGNFTFSRVQLSHAGAHVQGRAMISATDQLSASFEGNVSDLASLGAFMPALKSGVVKGEAKAQIELEGPLREPKAEATLHLVDASILGANARALEMWILSPRLGKNPEAEMRLRGEQIGYKAWLAPQATASILRHASGAIELKELHLQSAERGEIVLAGQLKFPSEDRMSASFDTFHMRSPDGTLSWTNQGRVAVEREGGSTKVTGIDLRGGPGRISGEIDHLAEGRTRIALEGENVKLGDFTTYFRSSQRMTGNVNFKSNLVLENGRPTGNLDLDLRDGEWQEDQIEQVSAHLVAASGRVSLSPVTVRSSLVNFDLSGIVHAESVPWDGFFKGSEARREFLREMSFENVAASIDAPSLDALHARFPKFPTLGGSGSAQLTLAGTGLDPHLEFRGQVHDGRLGWKPVQSLVFSGAFLDSTLAVRECRLESQGGSAVIEANLPLAWADLVSKPRLLHDRPVFLRITAEKFPVQTLAVIDTLFTWGDGPFWANAQLDGTLDEPRVTGAFRVERGTLTLPLFDRPLSDGIVEGRLHTDGIEITSFTFEDGWGNEDRRGTAKGKARIDFDRLKLVNYRVDVRLQDFRYRGFTDIDAIGDGVLSVTPQVYGDKKVPFLVGKFDLARADLNERLMTPPQQKLEAPPGVNVPIGPEPEEEQEGRLRRAGDPPPVLAELAFSGRKNLWMRTPQMNVEFEGDVTLHATDRYVGITGETRSLRGTYTLYNTRFDIERAEIEFTDPEQIGDSYIDAIATTSVLDEDVEVHVSGSIAKPIIESTSSSGYSEAEIYRLLALRIKRADEAGGAVDESDFSRDLVASWGALVASRFGSNLTHELGIDTFDLDVSETSSQVGLGKYLGSDFFVRYRQQVSSTDPSTRGITEERLETPERQLLLEYRLSRILRLQGETGTVEGDGYLNVDLRAEWGY
jgi:autotransporter translocation and assembly factor TamB